MRQLLCSINVRDASGMDSNDGWECSLNIDTAQRERSNMDILNAFTGRESGSRVHTEGSCFEFLSRRQQQIFLIFL